MIFYQINSNMSQNNKHFFLRNRIANIMNLELTHTWTKSINLHKQSSRNEESKTRVKNNELTDEGIKSDEAMVRTKLFSFLHMLIAHN